jgi:transmembrane sensor
MQYTDYQIADFLKDDDFVQWVRNPTHEQNIFWQNWLTQHTEKAQVVAEARAIILSTRYQNVYTPSDADLVSVWNQIQFGEKSQLSARRQLPRLTLPLLLRGIAAVGIVALGSFLVWQQTDKSRSPENRVVVNVNRLDVKTAALEKRVVILPDGSTVKMNSRSKISYLSDFGKGNRELQLEGEAFFDVVPDSARPFRIYTGRLQTTVVGTTFNISAYAEDPHIRVAVKTGKVEVAEQANNDEAHKLLLMPDQMSLFEKAGNELTATSFDPDIEFGWTYPVIVLKNADFQEIKRVIEKEYAVTFVVEKGLRVREEFSAKFENAPLAKVLDALNYTSRFQYNLIKDKIYITRKDEK